MASLTANNVTPSSTTTYSVYVEDANGCVSSIEPIVVSLNPALSVSALSDQSICEGENASISAIANGGNSGPYTYSWDQGIGSGGIQTVAPAVTTTYTVTANDGCETPAASASITITVNLLPSPSFTPNLTDGCVPLDVEFTEDISTGCPYTIIRTWSVSDLCNNSVEVVYFLRSCEKMCESVIGPRGGRFAATLITPNNRK